MLMQMSTKIYDRHCHTYRLMYILQLFCTCFLCTVSCVLFTQPFGLFCLGDYIVCTYSLLAMRLQSGIETVYRVHQLLAQCRSCDCKYWCVV